MFRKIILYLLSFVIFINVGLTINYIKIEFDKNKVLLYTYGVEFDPIINLKPIKSYLLKQRQILCPIKMFDGLQLYIPNILP